MMEDVRWTMDDDGWKMYDGPFTIRNEELGMRN